MKPFAFGVRPLRRASAKNDAFEITLPMPWIRSNGLKHGTNMWIEMGENGELRIFPYEKGRFEQMMAERRKNDGRK